MKRRTPHESRIRQAMQLWGQATPEAPTMPSAADRIRRVRLIFEEAFEFAEAAAVEVAYCNPGLGPGRGDVPLQFHTLSFKLADSGDADPDMVLMVDALADCSVVVTGGFIDCGVCSEPILESVDSNNLDKAGRGHLDPMTGKFIKPEDHQPPPIPALLRLQGWGC